MSTANSPAARDAPTVALPPTAPEPHQPESTGRAAVVANVARMASGEGLESELNQLRLHLEGIELALRGLDEAGIFSPRSVMPLVETAQDRIAGIIASLAGPAN